MLNQVFWSQQDLFGTVFSSLCERYDAQRLILPVPICTDMLVNNPQQQLEQQPMAYQDFLYIDFGDKLWVLCLGKHEGNNGHHYAADLSALRFFNTQLEPDETLSEIKHRLNLSRTFLHSLFCGHSSGQLCFPLESMYAETIQSFSMLDPASFWVEPHQQSMVFSDGVFREPRITPGFFLYDALAYLVDLADRFLTDTPSTV